LLCSIRKNNNFESKSQPLDESKPANKVVFYP